MAPQHSTRIRPRSEPPPAPTPKADGLDLQTLLLSAIASAVSAYVTSKVWAAGTLWAAAMSPVIVALVKEGLRKPAEVVTSAVPSPRGLATRPSTRPAPPRQEPLPDDLTERFDGGAPPPFPPPAAGAPAGPVRVYSTKGRRLRWRLAVITGLLGFVICVLIYTVPEIIAGRSVVHSADKTTFWGGSRHKSKSDRTPASTTTTQAPTTSTPKDQQPVQTVTAPPQTVTVPAPTATTPPEQTTPPAETAPAPTPGASPDGTATTPAG